MCGVIPRRKTNKSSPGPAGDPRSQGRLGDVTAAEVEISSIIGTDRFHYANLTTFGRDLREGKVCFALAIGEGGRIEPHLVSSADAFGKADPTFLSVFTACRTKKTFYDFKTDLTVLNESKRQIFDKVLYSAASDKIAGSQRMNATEGKVARDYNQGLIGRYKSHVEDEKALADLDRKVSEIEARVRPENAAGAVQENLIVQREAQIYSAIRETETERIQRCLCDALMVRCPEPGEAPFLVPISCLKGNLDGREVVIDEVCPHCCRKQAMSWHWLQYFVSPIRRSIGLGIAGRCCPEEEPPQPGRGLQIEPNIRIPRIDLPLVFDPFVDPLWDPPRMFTEVEPDSRRVGGWSRRAISVSTRYHRPRHRSRQDRAGRQRIRSARRSKSTIPKRSPSCARRASAPIRTPRRRPGRTKPGDEVA